MEYSKSLRQRYREVVQATHLAILELVAIVEERRLAELLDLPEPVDLYARLEVVKVRIRQAQNDARDLRAEIASEQTSAGHIANADSIRGLEVPDFLPEGDL